MLKSNFSLIRRNRIFQGLEQVERNLKRAAEADEFIKRIKDGRLGHKKAADNSVNSLTSFYMLHKLIFESFNFIFCLSNMDVCFGNVVQ